MSAEFDPNFSGLWAPRKVLLCPLLKGYEVLMFAQIAALSGNPRGCYAQNPYFMKFLKLAKSTVSEMIAGLADKGLVDVLRGKDDDGKDERQIFLSAAGAQLFAPDVPIRAVARASEDAESEGSPQRTAGFAPANEGVRPSEPENKYINTSPGASAREAPEGFYDAVMTAAGDAIDLNRHPHIALVRDLIYLLSDLPTSAACTVDEVTDAVRFVAGIMVKKHGVGSMKSWDFACTKAREYRDKRINGHPVRTVEPKVQEGIGEPKTFDETKWRTLIELSNIRDGQWKDDWGPPPGAEGSFVPPALAAEWKGAMAQVPS